MRVSNGEAVVSESCEHIDALTVQSLGVKFQQDVRADPGQGLTGADQDLPLVSFDIDFQEVWFKNFLLADEAVKTSTLHSALYASRALRVPLHANGAGGDELAG